MRILSRIAIGTLLVVSFCQHGYAQIDYGFDFSKAGSAGLQFLKIEVGALESSLGGAVTSLTDDANAVFWNPAGLGSVRNVEILSSQNKWFINSRLNSVSATWPRGSIIFALSALAFDVEDFEETTVLQPQGTGNMISAGNTLLGAAVAKRFTDRLSIGGQVKMVEENLDTYSHRNVLFDIGTIYYTGYRDLRIGFVFQHFGPDMKLVDKKFRTPLLFRSGISDILYKSDIQKLTASFDLVHPTDNNEWVNYGVEYKFAEVLSLRGGYRAYRDNGSLTFGFGLNLDQLSDSIGIEINYSYMNFNEILGDIHRFSFGIEFGDS